MAANYYFTSESAGGTGPRAQLGSKLKGWNQPVIFWRRVFPPEPRSGGCARGRLRSHGGRC